MVLDDVAECRLVRLTVASSMNFWRSFSGSSSGRFGFFGGLRRGVGIWTEKFDSAAPRKGRAGMVPLCIRRERVVLYPGGR